MTTEIAFKFLKIVAESKCRKREFRKRRAIEEIL